MLRIQGFGLIVRISTLTYFSDVGPNSCELDDDGILGMWLLLWRLLCGRYHGLVLLQAVREQLAGLDRNVGRLAQYCVLTSLLPEEVEFLLGSFALRPKSNR